MCTDEESTALANDRASKRQEAGLQNPKVLTGAPEMSAEINKAHTSHKALVMSERPWLYFLLNRN